MKALRSEEFRLGRWHCYWLMLIHQAPYWGLAVGLLALAMIVAGFILSPWIGLAAIGFSAFLVVMVVTFVIAVYGFHSITGCNMTPHRLFLTDSRIGVEFDDEGRDLTVSRSEARPYRIFPGGVLVPIEGERAGWLWIPPRAFENDEDFKTFLKKIYEGNTGKE